MTARERSKSPAPWRCARCSRPVELRHAVKHYAEDCSEREHGGSQSAAAAAGGER